MPLVGIQIPYVKTYKSFDPNLRSSMNSYGMIVPFPGEDEVREEYIAGTPELIRSIEVIYRGQKILTWRGVTKEHESVLLANTPKAMLQSYQKLVELDVRDVGLIAVLFSFGLIGCHACAWLYRLLK